MSKIDNKRRYPLKTILALSILLSAIAHTAHSEQPQNSVETDIAVIKPEIKNLKETISTGFDNVQTQFATVQTQLDSVQKTFDRQNNIIIACIGIPLALKYLNCRLYWTDSSG